MRQRKLCDAEGITFNGERYEVKLPLKTEAQNIPNHYQLSLDRLHYLQRRLKKTELTTVYDDIIKEQLDAGIIEPVENTENNYRNKGTHYLPHHGVIKEDRETTKLRIVFDGSAKQNKRESSLNDCLEKGPNLTPHVFKMLAKFRSYPIGITADIEKAFHQIEITTADRDLLRFLWLETPEDEQSKIKVYRFARLVFGLTPSPAILNGTIQHHLSQYKLTEPEVYQLLANSFYVDDLTAGADNTESAFQLYHKARRIMREGRFQSEKVENKFGRAARKDRKGRKYAIFQQGTATR